MPFCILIPSIVNINTCFSFDTRFNLNELKEKHICKDVKKKFKAIVLRIGKATFNIYENGQVIMAGLRTEEDCISSCQKLGELLSSDEKILHPIDFRITNLVLSGCFGRKISLENLHKEIRRSSANGGRLSAEYEPELFSGLRCSLKNSKRRITIFRSGKFFITGVKNENDSNEIFHLSKSFVDFVENIIPIK